MGGRGSFINVDAGDFNFKIGGQQYVSKGMIGDVKIIEKINSDNKPVSAPFMSHTADRIYATIKNGKLKHLTFYKNHNQVKSIDFDHAHNGVRPHVHFNGQHGASLPGISPTKEDFVIIEKVRRGLKK